MNEFKVGDVVVAKDDYYNVTSLSRLCVCEVIEVYDQSTMQVRVVSALTDVENDDAVQDCYINSIYTVHPSHFEHLRSIRKDVIKHYCNNLARLSLDIKEGDTVLVIDVGKQYSSYYSLFRHCKNKELAAYFQPHRTIDDRKTYTIKEILKHPEEETVLAILLDERGNYSYIMGVEGLMKANDKDEDN